MINNGKVHFRVDSQPNIIHSGVIPVIDLRVIGIVSCTTIGSMVLISQLNGNFGLGLEIMIEGSSARIVLCGYPIL